MNVCNKIQSVPTPPRDSTGETAFHVHIFRGQIAAWLCKSIISQHSFRLSITLLTSWPRLLLLLGSCAANRIAVAAVAVLTAVHVAPVGTEPRVEHAVAVATCVKRIAAGHARITPVHSSSSWASGIALQRHGRWRRRRRRPVAILLCLRGHGAHVVVHDDEGRRK